MKNIALITLSILAVSLISACVPDGIILPWNPITGENIEDGTIEGKDIKANSITWGEIVDTRRIVVAAKPPLGSGGGDFGSIQAAIDSTGSGPSPNKPLVILVMPGLYNENISIDGTKNQSIHIIGLGPEITVIKSPLNFLPVINLVSDNRYTIISGLTVTGGEAGIRVGPYAGEIIIRDNAITQNRKQGILLEGNFTGNIRIYNNRIEKNGEVGGSDNAGIMIRNASPFITDNYFFENSIGIHYKGGSPKIRANTILVNGLYPGCERQGQGVWCAIGIGASGGSGVILNNEIVGGRRGGIVLTNSSPYIKDNKISSNHVGIDFGPSTFPPADNSSPDITDNLIIANDSHGIYSTHNAGHPRIFRNTIRNNEEDGIFLEYYSNRESTLDGGGAIISQNVVYGNKSGVDVRVSNCANGSHVTISHNIVNKFLTSIVCVEGGFNSRVNGASFPHF